MKRRKPQMKRCQEPQNLKLTGLDIIMTKTVSGDELNSRKKRCKGQLAVIKTFGTGQNMNRRIYGRTEHEKISNNWSLLRNKRH